ncbi:MAG: hypothetical protein GXZ06_04640 [Tissierellia bacterium]|nr:hypothetical protein [Tissierellia bacterium]
MAKKVVNPAKTSVRTSVLFSLSLKNFSITIPSFLINLVLPIVSIHIGQALYASGKQKQKKQLIVSKSTA